MRKKKGSLQPKAPKHVLNSGGLTRSVTTLECGHLERTLLAGCKVFEASEKAEKQDYVCVHLEWRRGPVCEVPWDAVPWERPETPVVTRLAMPNRRFARDVLVGLYDERNARWLQSGAHAANEESYDWCLRVVLSHLMSLGEAGGEVDIGEIREQLLHSGDDHRVAALRPAFNYVASLTKTVNRTFVSDETLRSVAAMSSSSFRRA